MITLDRLAELLRSRTLPSESIVKVTAVTIGSHWHARQSAFIVPADSDAKRVKRRHDAEEIALDFMLAFFGVLVQTAIDELDEIPATNPIEEVDLDQHISAVLRRLLPALRIMSKWIKFNVEYVSRFSSTPNESLASEIHSFWARYQRLTTVLPRLFPLARLPTLSDPLEEDTDMRGFVPFGRAISVQESREKDINGHGEAPHPNEEQLMRIADLQVDAKLLVQSGVRSSWLNPCFG